MQKPRTLQYFVVLIIVIGILELLNQLLLTTSMVAVVISILLLIIGLIITFWGGRVSKMAEGHPAGRGALLGAIYGVIAGISVFFLHISPGRLQSGLGHSASSGSAKSLADMINSPSMHVVSYLISIAIYALGGLIVGAIGGATTKKQGS